MRCSACGRRGQRRTDQPQRLQLFDLGQSPPARPPAAAHRHVRGGFHCDRACHHHVRSPTPVRVAADNRWDFGTHHLERQAGPVCHPAFALLCSALLCFALLCFAVALRLLLLLLLPGSLPQRRMDRGKTRRAAHMDVRRPRQGQDAPSADPRCIRGPVARSAEGARQGVLSFGYFSLHEQRKVTRPRAEAFAVAFLLASLLL